MKIIHICQFLGIGGLEKVLFSLINEQLIMGHQVEVIVYDHDRRWVKKYESLNIKVHTDFNKKNGYDLSLLKYLKKITKNYDIIHTHDLNPMLYMGVIRLFNLKLNLIHTTHGMEHLETHPKTNLYESFLGLMAKSIVAVSPKFQRHYERQFLTNNKKIYLVNNGTAIDKLLFKKPKEMYRISICNEFSLNPKIPIAIYVARVVPLKAQYELMQTFQNIKHQLLIVGPSGNNEYFMKCMSLKNKRIVMTGPRDDIDRLLKGADYFISASLHEGLPIAVLEAASCSLPCLLFDIPGHSTFNQNDECVLLYKNNNELLDKTNEILNDKDKFINNFTKLIQDKYSSKTMARRYLEIYQANL